jgi:hypothetical protein
MVDGAHEKGSGRLVTRHERSRMLHVVNQCFMAIVLPQLRAPLGPLL